MSDDADDRRRALRRELERIMAETQEESHGPGARRIEPGSLEKRRLRMALANFAARFWDPPEDNRHGDRAVRKKVYFLAAIGLAFVKRGDDELAEQILWGAQRMLLYLYRRISAEKMMALGKPLTRPGRRPDPEKTARTAERNRRLADAYDEQVAAGKRPGQSAMIAALKGDPWLWDACKDLTLEGLKKAAQRGRRNRE